MSVMRAARTAGSLAIQLAASEAQQNFLGAPWVAGVVNAVPERVRARTALRLLSFSPHYFYGRDVRAEAERNRRSRQAIAEALIAPHLDPRARVIDYGCGPGYMARAVAGMAARVDAVDVSRGVLACARVLNGVPGVSYLTPGELARGEGRADLAYSFAVVQHMRTEAVKQALRLIAAKVRSGGTLLVHFAEPGPEGWRTEAQWDADQSLAGRVRRRYGLNCFGRTPEEMRDLAAEQGFTGVTVRSLRGQLKVPGDDDITGQHILIAWRA